MRQKNKRENKETKWQPEGKKVPMALVWAAVIFLVLVCALAVYQLYYYVLGDSINQKKFDALQDQVISTRPILPDLNEEKPDEMAGENSSETEATLEETENMLKDTILDETAPITVDFVTLSQRNPDVIGWIYGPGSSISYPIVRTEDNDYYLHRSFDRQSNAAGTIFMDCRNAGDFTDQVSIIYGHNMKSGSMFGELANYKWQPMYDRCPTFYLLTPDVDYKVSLISAYVTDIFGEVFTIPVDKNQKNTLVKNSMDISTFVSKTTPQEFDRVLVMSTCSYEFSDARFVVLGIMQRLR